MWKDFFYFSRRERQGILILIVLLAGIFIGKFLFSPRKQTPIETHSTNISTPLADSLKTSQSVHTEIPVESIVPDESQTEEKRTYYNKHSDNLPYARTEKFPVGTVINLNTADSATLTKIPGIGPAFSKRIVGYRNLLGGYYRIEQLQEIYGMYEELYEKIKPYFNVDYSHIAPIAINDVSLDQLKRHPYLKIYQAKAIIELRKKKGALEGIEDLKPLKEFNNQDWERLSPYLSF